VANVFDPDFDPADAEDRPGFTYRRARIGRQAGARRLGASLFELPPGQALFPYHWHAGNEEMLIVLSGRPSVRTPEGWRQLEVGEVVSFPRGPEGAHHVLNRSEQSSRVLMLSEMNAPEVVAYPDTEKISARTRPPGAVASESDVNVVFRLADRVDYWQDEQPPGDG
jgi:uncharacterized cupin superfamily protein